MSSSIANSRFYMATFKGLLVWQKNMNLARRVYETTASYPSDEKFGLVSQLRRCAVSIPSNIAEGHGRDSFNERVHFLYVSSGSSNELETQLILSRDFGFIDEVTYQELSRLNDEISRMLSSLIYTLKHKTEKRTWCLEDKLLLINLHRHEQKGINHESTSLWPQKFQIKLMNLYAYERINLR